MSQWQSRKSCHFNLEAELQCNRLSGGLKFRMLNWIASLWCRKVHSGAMWPIHGRYICPQCLREYPVEWSADEIAGRIPASETRLALEARRRLTTTS